MPSPKAVLADITDLDLDPHVDYKEIKNGRLVKRISIKHNEIVAQETEPVNVTEVSSTDSKEIQSKVLLLNQELVVNDNLIETKIDDVKTEVIDTTNEKLVVPDEIEKSIELEQPVISVGKKKTKRSVTTD